MKELTTLELKKVSLEIMKKFDEICNEYNLKYSVCGGTLIGAVRHKGFIPWDDDIDVLMPRDDYNKLLELNIGGNYKILSFHNTNGYYYPYAKMIDTKTLLIEKNNASKPIGVFVDIFPIDYLNSSNYKKSVDDNKKEFNKYLLYCTKSNNLKIRIVQNLIQLLFWWRRKSIVNKFLDYINKKSDSNGSCSFNFTNPPYGIKEFFEYRIFEDDFIYMDFENIKVKCFKNYDRFLTHVFGNYMELPPVEKRVSHHSFVAYWKE